MRSELESKKERGLEDRNSQSLGNHWSLILVLLAVIFFYSKGTRILTMTGELIVLAGPKPMSELVLNNVELLSEDVRPILKAGLSREDTERCAFVNAARLDLAYQQLATPTNKGYRLRTPEQVRLGIYPRYRVHYWNGEIGLECPRNFDFGNQRNRAANRDTRKDGTVSSKNLK